MDCLLGSRSGFGGSLTLPVGVRVLSRGRPGLSQKITLASPAFPEQYWFVSSFTITPRHEKNVTVLAASISMGAGIGNVARL